MLVSLGQNSLAVPLALPSIKADLIIVEMDKMQWTAYFICIILFRYSPNMGYTDIEQIETDLDTN